MKSQFLKSRTYLMIAVLALSTFASCEKDQPLDEIFSSSPVETISKAARENLALGKETKQSSTIEGKEAEKAVDGIVSNSNSSTTKTEVRPWWQVQLGAEYEIGDIVIYNRTDSKAANLVNFDVFVYNSAGTLTYKAFVKDAPSPSIVLNAGGVKGSRVRIRLKEENILSLAEVQVFEVESLECIPTVPSGRSADVSANTATLSWNAIPNIDHCNVRYRQQNTSEWSIKKSIRTNSVTINGLSYDTDYEWQVRCKCEDGSGSSYAASQSTFTTGTNTSGLSPFNLLGLDGWKLTLPKDLDKNGDPDEIFQLVELNTYKGDTAPLGEYDDPKYFTRNGEWARFICPAQGPSTNGSSFPRAELREMQSGGAEERNWDLRASTKRSLEFTGRVIETPSSGKVVFFQIHALSGVVGYDDIIRIQVRTKGAKKVGDKGTLYIMGDVVNEVNDDITKDYILGEEFTFKVVAQNSTVSVFFEGKKIREYKGMDSPFNYFKAGSYVQSKPKTGFGVIEFKSIVNTIEE